MCRIKRILLWLSMGLCSVNAAYAMNWDMSPGVTDVSQDVFGLHRIILLVCVVVFVLVVAVMLWAIVFHRKSRGAKAAHFHENVFVEILWTMVPFFILVAIAIPATKTLIVMDDDDDAELTVLITGHQWKWHYQYRQYQDDPLDIGFFSELSTPQEQIHNHHHKGEHYLLEVDKPLVLPINTKIRFLITSADVLHSWWVKDLAVKQDAVPGFINARWTRINEAGTYRGQCAELCGVHHAFMPIVVEAVTPEAFQQWLKQQQQLQAEAALAAQQAALQTLTREQLMTQGEAVYQQKCASCHQANGAGIPGVFPALQGSAIAQGDVATHIGRVLFGVKGTAMPSFKAQLSPTEVAAVVTYERFSWGNQGQQLVQAADVLALSQPKSSDTTAVTPPLEAVTPAEPIEVKASETVMDGQALYLQHCAACHQASGAGVPNVFPALQGSAIVAGPVEAHIQRVWYGVSGTAMMPFGQSLTVQQVAAIVAYERQQWGSEPVEVSAEMVQSVISKESTHE